MSTRSIVLAEIETVAREQKKELLPLGDELLLLQSGLDSLCFAILVSRLEDSLGVDPFIGASQDQIPRTIGQLVAFYDSAQT